METTRELSVVPQQGMMTRIRNKNKRQENKNILLTNNKKQEKK